MVYLHTCFQCENGNHERCEGDVLPMNQGKDGEGPVILGGSSCQCSCGKKAPKAARRLPKEDELVAYENSITIGPVIDCEPRGE